MSVLTLDLSTLDEELEELLSDSWAVRLYGRDVDDLSLRPIPSPPVNVTLVWEVWDYCTVHGVDVLHAGQPVRSLPFSTEVRMAPTDHLTLMLELTR